MSTESQPVSLEQDPLASLISAVIQAEEKDTLSFVIANGLHRLTAFRQAAFFRFSPLTDKAEDFVVSGLAEVDPQGAFLQWLGACAADRRDTVLAAQKKDKPPLSCVTDFTATDMPTELAEEWGEWNAAHALILFFYDASGQIESGLWLTRTAPFSKDDFSRLELIGNVFAHALLRFPTAHAPMQKVRDYFAPRKRRVALAIIATGLLFFPVRLSVLAPAEIVPEEPIIVSAPVDGVIADIAVLPNTVVKAGDALFTLDETDIKNRHAMAVKALDIATASYRKNAREAFRQKESRAELSLLKARIMERQSEVAYMQDMLDKMLVTAPADGVVLFSDENEWRGRPVRTGERVMTVADPQKPLLLAHLPVNEVIHLKELVPLKLFLNNAPLKSLSAIIKTVSYDAVRRPEGHMAYPVRARFKDGTVPRIGMKGTAKLYGARVPFLYQVLRRPLLSLRRITGL
jgi:hypothetical protein